MRLVDNFESMDLVYGFREDLENYINDLENKFPDKKYFTQSYVNKDLVESDSEHAGHLKSPNQKKPIVRSYGTMLNNSENIVYRDENRAHLFFMFLAINFKKYSLIEITTQCNLFKRLCKQGIQYAKQNKSKIHFILDTIYNQEERHKSIITKGENSSAKCTDCDVDAVTASELRSIFRDWSNLKDTIVFWYHNQKVDAPWEDVKYKDLWKMYEPRSWGMK